MFKVTISRKEGQTLNEILIDFIASAAYFYVRDLGVRTEGDKINFYHKGHMPIGEYAYLSEKYKPNLSISVVDS